MTETNSSMPTDNKPLKPLPVYSYPKIIFFYPLAIAAVICGFLSLGSWKNQTPRHDKAPLLEQIKTQEVPMVDAENDNVPDFTESNQKPERTHFNLGEYAAAFFLLIFFLNMLVISFDFPGMKALATLLIILVFFLVCHLLGSAYQLPILSWINFVIHWVLLGIDISARFYFLIAAVVVIMIIIAIVHQRGFDKWIIEPTRLTHVKGIMREYTEYPVIDLQVDKKIDDVFELCLLGAGTLVFRPNVNTAPIYLENVPFISHKEKKIKALTRNRMGK